MKARQLTKVHNLTLLKHRQLQDDSCFCVVFPQNLKVLDYLTEQDRNSTGSVQKLVGCK